MEAVLEEFLNISHYFDDQRLLKKLPKERISLSLTHKAPSKQISVLKRKKNFLWWRSQLLEAALTAWRGKGVARFPQHDGQAKSVSLRHVRQTLFAASESFLFFPPQITSPSKAGGFSIPKWPRQASFPFLCLRFMCRACYREKLESSWGQRCLSVAARLFHLFRVTSFDAMWHLDVQNSFRSMIFARNSHFLTLQSFFIRLCRAVLTDSVQGISEEGTQTSKWRDPSCDWWREGNGSIVVLEASTLVAKPNWNEKVTGRTHLDLSSGIGVVELEKGKSVLNSFFILWLLSSILLSLLFQITHSNKYRVVTGRTYKFLLIFSRVGPRLRQVRRLLPVVRFLQVSCRTLFPRAACRQQRFSEQRRRHGSGPCGWWDGGGGGGGGRAASVRNRTRPCGVLSWAAGRNRCKSLVSIIFGVTEPRCQYVLCFGMFLTHSKVTILYNFRVLLLRTSSSSMWNLFFTLPALFT